MFVTNNAVYVDIPKTGSRTIQQTLSDHFGGSTLPDHLTIIPKHHEHLFAFTAVRNPYDRACSLWWSTCKRDITRKGFCTKMENSGLENTLESFLIVLEDTWGNISDVGYRFARSQIDYLESNDFGAILKHETLERDFNDLPFVQNHIALEHLNATQHVWKMNPYSRPGWNILKTDKCVEIINNLYKDDFNQLGYEYE